MDLLEPMSSIAERIFTVPEVAFVAGVPDKIVQREIDAGIVDALPGEEARAVGFPDVLYLAVVRDLRTGLAPKMRADLRRRIADALRRQARTVRLGVFTTRLDRVEGRLRARLRALEKVDAHIVSRAGVRAGEPVIKGTRIPARLIAGLVRQGATTAELARDYEIGPEQVEAAVLFDRLHAKRGRPAVAPIDVVRHVPPDR